jgi:hypothetical protein
MYTTEDQIKAKLRQYLTKTAEHYFLNEDNTYTKLFTLKLKDGSWAYIYLRIRDGLVYLHIGADRILYIDYYRETIQHYRNWFFPQYTTRKAIKQTKEFKHKIKNIKKLVYDKYSSGKDLNKIKDLIKYIL